MQAPAPASASNERNNQLVSNEIVRSQRPRKRGVVNVSGACGPCRKGKRKCDGGKPICNACRKRVLNSTPCVYDNLEGFSRAETLKHNLQCLQDDRDALRFFVKDLLTFVSTPSAQECMRDHAHDHATLYRALGGKTSEALDSIVGAFHDGSDADSGMFSPKSSTSAPAAALGKRPGWLPLKEDHNMSPMSTTASSINMSSTDDHYVAQSDNFTKMKRSESYVSNSDSTPSSGSKRRRSSDSSGEPLNPFFQIQMQDRSVNRPPFISPSSVSQKKRVASHIQIYGELPLSLGGGDAESRPDDTGPGSRLIDLMLPVHFIQPVFLQECGAHYLSKTILGFLDLARTRIREGWPLESILGPVHFDVSRILVRPVRDDQSYYPNSDEEFTVGEWAINVLNTFRDMNVLSRLIGAVYFARLMRWLISPTAENYHLIHETQRPTPTQLLVPHIAEYSFNLFPAQRDALIKRPREYLGGAQHYHCLWNENIPYTYTDTLSNTTLVTTAFENYAMDPDNWAVDPIVFQIFPELQGVVKVWQEPGQ